MPTIATVLNSTLTSSRKKLLMAAVKSHAFMAWAFASERVETEDGGYNITNPLTIGRNPTVGSYEYYDDLDVRQTDEFITVDYGWSRVAGTVIISDQEEDENTGDTAVFKLMKAKMEVLEESIKERFSSYCYGVGGGLDPLGLQALIPDDPTTGTLGNVSRVGQNQWRTSSYDFAGTLNATNIEEALDDVLLDLTVKGDKPSVMFVGRNIYRIYRAAVRDKITLPMSESNKGKRMMDLGFGGISHQNIPLVYDEDCPIDRAYVINDKYLRMHILKNVNMRVKDLNSPWTIDAVGKRVVWQGQMCLWKAYRSHAVVND